MFLLDALFAGVIAILLTILVAGLLGGYRAPQTLLLFFLLVLLAAWIGGAWAAPFGPVLAGVYWVPFILFGLLFALLLLALLPSDPPVEPTGLEPGETAAQAGILAALDWVFWLLVIVMLVALVVPYIFI
ncbi:MAG: hypothetical protein GYB64_06205 [Chloroflexi bacterium]|nr:hypothetical protein [Chloroflexota bacterium]